MIDKAYRPVKETLSTFLSVSFPFHHADWSCFLRSIGQLCAFPKKEKSLTDSVFPRLPPGSFRPLLDLRPLPFSPPLSSLPPSHKPPLFQSPSCLPIQLSSALQPHRAQRTPSAHSGTHHPFPLNVAYCISTNAVNFYRAGAQLPRSGHGGK